MTYKFTKLDMETLSEALSIASEETLAIFGKEFPPESHRVEWVARAIVLRKKINDALEKERIVRV